MSKPFCLISDSLSSVDNKFFNQVSSISHFLSIVRLKLKKALKKYRTRLEDEIFRSLKSF